MYKEYYRTNSKNGNIVIDVRFNSYSDFYHSLDNALFKVREINPELKEYLDICSIDIPVRKKLEIDFTIAEEQDKKTENEIMSCFKNYYKFLLRLQNITIRNGIFTAILLAFVSVALMVANIFLSGISLALPEIIQNIVGEGLSIGSWVFLWEALHIITFQTLKNVNKQKEFKRFINAKLKFNNNAG